MPAESPARADAAPRAWAWLPAGLPAWAFPSVERALGLAPAAEVCRWAPPAKACAKSRSRGQSLPSPTTAWSASRGVFAYPFHPPCEEPCVVWFSEEGRRAPLDRSTTRPSSGCLQQKYITTSCNCQALLQTQGPADPSPVTPTPAKWYRASLGFDSHSAMPDRSPTTSHAWRSAS